VIVLLLIGLLVWPGWFWHPHEQGPINETAIRVNAVDQYKAGHPEVNQTKVGEDAVKEALQKNLVVNRADFDTSEKTRERLQSQLDAFNKSSDEREKSTETSATGITQNKIIKDLIQIPTKKISEWNNRGWTYKVKYDGLTYTREGGDNKQRRILEDQGIEDYHEAVVKDSKTSTRDNPVWKDMTGFTGKVESLRYQYDSDGNGKDKELIVSQDDSGNLGYYLIEENNDNLDDKIELKDVAPVFSSTSTGSEQESSSGTVNPDEPLKK
jgi:hypothetical protein